MATRFWSPWMKQFAQIVAVAAVYYVTGRLGVLLAIPPGIATAVWAPSGVALAAVLLWGYRVWLGIWLGSFLVNIGTLFDGSSLSSAVVSVLVVSNIGLGSTLQALLGAALIRRLTGSRVPFDRAQDVFKFVGIEALSCLIAPCFGVTGLCLGGFTPWSDYAYTWWTWWMGDLIGVLIVAPLLLIWSQRARTRWEPRRLAEAVLLVVLLLSVGQTVFGVPLPVGGAQISLAYIFIPFVLWAAFRFGQHGVVVLILMVAGVATWGTINGSGPFVREAVNNASLLLLQAFVGVVAVTGLVLAATLSERERAEEVLHRAHVELEVRVQERTEALVESNEVLQLAIAAHQRTEDALRESEQRYRSLVETARDVIFTLSADGTITSLNPAFETVTGWSRAEWLGQSFASLLHPDDLPRAMERFQRVLRGETLPLHEWRVRSKSGEYLVGEFTTAPQIQDGKVVGVFGIARDITRRKRAEEELSKRERLLAEAQRLAHLGSWEWDIPSNMVTWSDELYRIYGLQPQEFGATFEAYLERVHPDDRERAMQVIETAYRDLKPFTFEERIVRPDGTIRILHSQGEVSADANGKPLRMRGVCQDITERRRAEEALRESEECFRLLAENAQDMIYRYRVAPAPGYEYVSPAATAITGYTPEEFYADPDLGFKLMHPEDRRLPGDVGRSLTSAGGLLLLRWIRKDGAVLWIEQRNTPIFDASGNLVAIEGIARDVTESRKKGGEKFLEFLNSLPDGVVVIKKDGDILWVNAQLETLLGYRREELIGQPVEVLLPEYLRDRHAGHRAGYVAAPHPRPMGSGLDLAARRKDGSEFPVEISLSPMESEEGLFVLAIVSDITERKRAERELQQAKEAAEAASRAKSEFLANMSHDIRTPMNTIIGMADLLWESPLTPEQREYVRIFRRAGGTLLSLLNDILDLSKVEAGRLELENAEFDLGELVERTTEILALRAHEKGLELACHISPDVPTNLVGDPNRLRQVLVNLLDNAIKFTEQGEVVLRVEVEGNGEMGEIGKLGNQPISQFPSFPVSQSSEVCLHFSVSDTGIGVPPEKLDTIFESFTQADSSITRKHEGTGLGLAISRRLVELMGGRIWVESRVGQGSAFYFTARFGRQAEPRWQAPPLTVDAKGLKILVVDDNATNRFILREMLNLWGASVTEAESGEQGLAELQRAAEAAEPYQLLLLDRRMPDMDGFQVAERIKHDLGITDVTIMMLTSDNRSSDIARCRELSIKGYLIKPIKRSDLLSAITAVMSRTVLAVEESLPVAHPVAPEVQHPLRILLVEDSEDNRLLIQFYLKDTPHQVDTAENGEIGVEKFKSGNYDLVLVDMQMPVMDGYTATQAMRQWESEKGVKPTPIIALTAYALKEEAQKSLKAGCTAHVAKPVKKVTLLETIYQHTRGEDHDTSE